MKFRILFVLFIITFFSCDFSSKKPSESSAHICMPSTFETNGDLDIINEIEYAINGSNEGMIFVEGGEFEMGGDNNEAKQDELPKHKVVVNSFWMDETEVTNNQFKEFIKATGYVTTAEKAIDWNEIKKILPPIRPNPTTVYYLQHH